MAGRPGTQISCEDWGVDGEIKFCIKINMDIYMGLKYRFYMNFKYDVCDFKNI